MENTKAFGTLYGIIIFLLLTLGLGVGEKAYITYISFTLMIVAMLYFIIHYTIMKEINILSANTDIKSIAFILFIMYGMLPVFRLSLNNSNNLQIVVYSGILIIFVIFFWINSIIINAYGLTQKLFNLIFYITFIFVLIVYIKNYQSVINFSSLLHVFDVNLRVRNSFGFVHFNTLGAICFVFLISSFYLKKFANNSNAKKTLIYACEFFMVLILLNTASRTAICCIVLFYVLFYINYSILMRNRLLYLFIAITLYALLYYIKHFNISAFLEYTNRYDDLLFNLKHVKDIGLAAFGIGNVSPLFLAEGANFGFKVNDNWFTYTLITSGAAGLATFFTVIMIKFRNIFLISGANLKETSFYRSLFIVNIVYALFENSYFVPASYITLVYWTATLCYMERNKNLTY